MNVPNQLTVARMILSPIFLVVGLLDFPYHYFLAAVIFSIAALTDFIDGRYARKYDLITNFGKLLDPVADKMLTTAALLLFVSQGWCHYLVPVIVLAREYLVTAVRMVASQQNIVIPANRWGKAKTVCQMVFSLIILYGSQLFAPDWELSVVQAYNNWFLYGAQILMWIVAVLTVISGATYVLQSKDLLRSAAVRSLLKKTLLDEFLCNLVIAYAYIALMQRGWLLVILVMISLTAGFGISSIQMLAGAQHVALPLRSWSLLQKIQVVAVCLFGLINLVLSWITPADAILLVPTQAIHFVFGALAVLRLAVCVQCMLRSKKSIDFSK